MSHSETDRYPARPLLFVVLMVVGVAYIVAFVLLRQHSRDFVAVELDTRASSFASALAPGEALSFGTAGNGVALLGAGWQASGDDGSWSDPEGGVLYLPAAVAGQRLHLEFAAHFYGGEEPLWVGLEVDGAAVAEWNPSPWAHVVNAEVLLPPASDPSQPLQLRFRIERHAALLWHGVPPGARGYGLRLIGLRLESPVGG